MIYHITTLKQWQTALEEGVYAPETFATDGFVHCSTDKQVLDVATRLYSHEKEILLLMIDEKLTAPEIVYENLEGGKEKYPHIYGNLNLEAVVNSAFMHKDQHGKFIFPTFTSNSVRTW